MNVVCVGTQAGSWKANWNRKFIPEKMHQCFQPQIVKHETKTTCSLERDRDSSDSGWDLHSRL
jgi:hypothetical protein